MRLEGELLILLLVHFLFSVPLKQGYKRGRKGPHHYHDRWDSVTGTY